MSYYPPPGSHQTVVYPGTPVAPSNYLSPQQLGPNVIYVPSRTNSRNSHHSHRHDDRERRHGRSHSDSHGHSHSSSSRKHRRHESDGHKHRRSSSHRRRDHSPQVVMVHPQAIPVAPSNGYYPDAYQYYRPTWTQRLRQFFGLAPNPRDYHHGHNTHSSGFFGRSRHQYRPGPRVDSYGRPIYR